MPIETLGSKSRFYAKIGKDDKSVFIEYGKRNKNGELSFDKIKLIWNKYFSLGERKNFSREYTDPRWAETPNRILAPYIAALIREFIRDIKSNEPK